MTQKNIPGSYILKGFDKGFFLVELIAGGKFAVQLQSLQEIKLYCYKNYFFACLLCSSGCRTSHFWFHRKQLVIFSLRLSLLGNIRDSRRQILLSQSVIDLGSNLGCGFECSWTTTVPHRWGF